MNQTPLVSICMLCYNHEKFVAESIESILSQSYENWELIIVNNASTDDSAKLIDQYTKKDPRITFLSQDTNTFVSQGINIAMKQAKGEYIALLSADDNFVPTKLEEQLGFMQTEALDLSFTWINAIDSHSKTSAPDVQTWFNKPDAGSLTDIVRYYFKMVNVTYAPTVMLKTSLLPTTFMHDHRLLQTQDMEYWLRLFKQTNNVAILHKKLTNYRVLEDGGNLSSNKSPEKVNRTNFEMIQLWKELFALDNILLCEVFQTEITEDNKYYVIYEHLKKEKIDVWQYAMLIQIYHTLGAECDVNSSLFKLFFEEYGKFSLVSESFLFEKSESINWLEEQLENYKKTVEVRDENILYLDQQLENHQKTLVAKEEGIVWLEEKVKTMEDEMKGQNEAIELYKQLLAKTDTAMLKLEEENVWLTQDLQSKEKVLEAKEEGISWLEQQLKNHQKTLADKEEGIVWLEEKVKTMEDEMKGQNEAIELYKQLLAKTDTAMLKLEEENVWFAQQLQKKDAYIHHLEQQVTCKVSLRRCTKRVLTKLIGKG